MPDEYFPKSVGNFLRGNEAEKKAKTILALGAIAAVGALAETLGIPKATPDLVIKVIDSLQHPLVGYMGAMAGDILSKGRLGRQKMAALFLGATAANFATETAQSWLLFDHNPTIGWATHAQAAETAKDAAFALGVGFNLYANQLAHEMRLN